jgi:hypothetical protein
VEFNRHTENTGKAVSSQPSKPLFFQPKLTINQPNDSFEQEADTMADKVMRMTDTKANQDAFFKPAYSKPVNNAAQRKCQACEEEEEHVQRKEVSSIETQSPPELDSYVASLHSSGQPLPGSSQSFFERSFGHDFSNVRIHNDGAAAKSAQSINALAYTTGNNIVFNTGQYAPDSDGGKKLMAHELTHVVQQGENVIRRYGQDNFCDTKKHLEPFIWPGHGAAIRMVANVLKAFSDKDPKLDSLLPNLFGKDALSHKAEIEANFKKINDRLNANYMYHCNDANNNNANPERCHGQRATTDTPNVHGFWGSPTYDIMLCFDVVDKRYSAEDVGQLIVHENYHRAFGDSNHPWALQGEPPGCGFGAPAGSSLLLDNPDSYGCLARAFS